MVAPVREDAAAFACFGSTCAVSAAGAGRLPAPLAVALAQRRLRGWHAQFTRFDAASELSRLNADPRETVPVTPVMARFVRAVVDAAHDSGGLVDATLLGALEARGYRGDLREPLPLADALALAPPRHAAGPSSAAAWRAIRVDGGAVTRPPGLRLDGGGLAKGLFADLLAAELAPHASFVVDCAGDLRVGGPARAVHVESPFDGSVLHRFRVAGCGVATSGIGRRAWRDDDGRPAHHLLDPATGRPAYTGVVQATALAPTALEAEVRAKTAVLSGPGAARGRLAHGGLVVYDDGGHDVVAPARA